MDLSNKKIRVAMLQIEDRIDSFFELAININKSYCILHEIDHILHRKGPIDKPPYWWKVTVFLDLLKTNKYDIICWMDSDAYVYDTKYDIRTFFDKINESMIICPDPEMWTSKFMAAVFMARNNQTSIKIFEDWLSLYNKNAWEKLSNGKWKYIGKGKWAGSDYEQGAFAENIMTRYQSDIKILPWYIFHEINCIKPHLNCWSIHVPGAYKIIRPLCTANMKKLLNGANTRNNLSDHHPKKIYLCLFFIILLITAIIIIIVVSLWYKD
jgi:hypothetical protein